VDAWLGTDPWGLLVLTLVGVIGGFARLLHLLRRFERLDRAER
jgi:F0F1-type ATP synthase assembly protein I